SPPMTKPAGSATNVAAIAPPAQTPAATTKPAAPPIKPASLTTSAGSVASATAVPIAPAAPAAADTPLVHGPVLAVVLLCPGMTINDAPSSDASRHINNFSTVVNINGETIAIDPIRDACLSSGFGERSGRLHKGIDFYNPAGGPIL